MIKTAVILAAGYGSRIGLYEKPKGFLNIGGRPMIEYSIQSLLMYGIEKIIIGAGFKSEFYERLARRYPQVVVRKNEDFLTSGSLNTLCSLRDLIEEDFLLLESDLLYDPHCIGKILALPRSNALLLAKSPNESDGVWVEADENRNLVKMSKDRSRLSDPLAGILVGIAKISLAAYQEMLRSADSELQVNPHQNYDFVFEKSPTKFFVFRIHNLLFTEVDDDDQLSFALNYIYPKLTFSGFHCAPPNESVVGQELFFGVERWGTAHSTNKNNE
jgi:2-aminoethylphosphonate-pyruvate transaminase